MPRNRTLVMTAGLMLSIFLASVESTIVATAMPTIVGQIGGIDRYSWAFTAFMVTSTTVVPIFGKLSDIYGRRPMYLLAMALFLIGSLACGLAPTIDLLIAARALQGVGAGGLLPLVFTIIGDSFSLEQRARMQGLFSGMWGISAVIGPLLGGFLVDRVAWQWVFLINLPPGLLAAALVGFTLPPRAVSTSPRLPIDWLGAGLLTVSVVLLLVALTVPGTWLSWGLLAATVVLAIWFVRVERQTADPVLPLRLFQERVFLAGCLHGLLAGCAIFGLTSFVPLFAQGVLGASPTAAGAALMPMLLGWVTASIVSSRLILRLSCRMLTISGTTLVVLGTLPLVLIGGSINQTLLLITLALIGIGMGTAIPAFLIAVQSTVPRQALGSATSTLQFSRSIGGALGTAVMGGVLTADLLRRAAALGLTTDQVNALIQPETGGLVVEGAARMALANAMQGVFVVALLTALGAFAATLWTPHGKVSELQAKAQTQTATTH